MSNWSAVTAIAPWSMRSTARGGFTHQCRECPLIPLPFSFPARLCPIHWDGREPTTCQYFLMCVRLLIELSWRSRRIYWHVLDAIYCSLTSDSPRKYHTTNHRSSMLSSWQNSRNTSLPIQKNRANHLTGPPISWANRFVEPPEHLLRQNGLQSTPAKPRIYCGGRRVANAMSCSLALREIGP